MASFGAARRLPRRPRNRFPRGAQARQAELDAIARDIALTEGRQDELEAEIAALDKDSAALNQTLIATGKRVQTLEERDRRRPNGG